MKRDWIKRSYKKPGRGLSRGKAASTAAVPCRLKRREWNGAAGRERERAEERPCGRELGEKYGGPGIEGVSSVPWGGKQGASGEIIRVAECQEKKKGHGQRNNEKGGATMLFGFLISGVCCFGFLGGSLLDINVV